MAVEPCWAVLPVLRRVGRGAEEVGYRACSQPPAEGEGAAGEGGQGLLHSGHVLAADVSQVSLLLTPAGLVEEEVAAAVAPLQCSALVAVAPWES